MNLIFGLFPLAFLTVETSDQATVTTSSILTQLITLAGVIYAITRLRTVESTAITNKLNTDGLKDQFKDQGERVDEFHKAVNSALTAANDAKLKEFETTKKAALDASKLAADKALESVSFFVKEIQQVHKDQIEELVYRIDGYKKDEFAILNDVIVRLKAIEDILVSKYKDSDLTPKG